MRTTIQSDIERSTFRVFCKRTDGGHERWCGGREIDRARHEAEATEGDRNAS